MWVFDRVWKPKRILRFWNKCLRIFTPQLSVSHIHNQINSVPIRQFWVMYGRLYLLLFGYLNWFASDLISHREIGVCSHNLEEIWKKIRYCRILLQFKIGFQDQYLLEGKIIFKRLFCKPLLKLGFLIILNLICRPNACKI